MPRMKFLETFALLHQFFESKVVEVNQEGEKKHAHMLHANIQAVEKISGKIVTWSLSVVGGTFLAILSDEYIHPEKRNYKYVYFIFILGWGCIAKSIHHGINVSGNSTAADRNADNYELLKAGSSDCQANFGKQLKWFKWGLAAFGVWLALYLCWWILADIPVKPK